MNITIEPLNTGAMLPRDFRLFRLDGQIREWRRNQESSLSVSVVRVAGGCVMLWNVILLVNASDHT